MRRSTLRALPPVDRTGEPGYRAWHAPVYGRCAVCGAGPMRLERHHVIAEQHVRAAHGDPWDLRDSWLLGAHCRCHSRHTTAAQRLPASGIPAPAIEFAIELLGAGAADAYIDRYYQ